MKKLLAIFLLVTTYNTISAQKLTLELLLSGNAFQMNAVREFNWMKDGNYFTALVRNPITGLPDILRYETRSGVVTDTIVNGSRLVRDADGLPVAFETYSFSDDESKILVGTAINSIYRRSSEGIYYVLDLSNQSLRPIFHSEKIMYPTFSPDGRKIAFVWKNNLYLKNTETENTIAITHDGEFNKVINGSADWVYEEELSLTKAFEWSPDGKQIAYFRFDESNVPLYNMQIWTGLYPVDYVFKYPKAGEANSIVDVHIYSLENGISQKIDLPGDHDRYLARLKWVPGQSILSVICLNRLQNQMDIWHIDAKTGSLSTIYTEKSDTYIDFEDGDDLTYLSNGKSFVLSSEKSGYRHIYHYDISGKLIGQLTKGDWQVTELCGIDEKNGKVYFLSTEISPFERHLYSVDLKGKKKQQITRTPGTHTAGFSLDFRFYIDNFSSHISAPRTSLHDAQGKEIKTLAENGAYQKKTEDYGFASTSFFTIQDEDGNHLNAYMMKPADFDSARQYPVLMYVYGGPGSQSVADKWNNQPWHHYLTQLGYLVVCVDNRGTGARGRDFQHITYKQLGKIETQDQIWSAKTIASMPFVDPERIGIWGWSYGGYMSSLCIMLGHEVFKTAIAVAPVTNWRFYDTIYTERYLQRPQENSSGYDEYSPVTNVDKLKGNFLLIHGTADDNVHFQNAVELQNALILANKQFESFFYPNRDHSIYGENTRLHLYTLMTRFILQNL